MPVVPRPNPEATMSFLEHLEELRRRVLWSLGALALGACVGFWVTTQYDVIGFLTGPCPPLLEDGRLTYLHPTEPFMVSIKVGIFVGAVIALPIVFYHFWRFVTPGLVESEKRIFIPALLASIGLFIGGAALAFFLVLPFGLRFFLGFSTESLQPMITINDYFSFAIQVTLMFGLVFETPLVILVLAWLGMPVRILKKYRRHAIALMAVISAIMTPADVVSMLLMLVPLYLLFEISVILAGVIEKRRERRASIATDTIGEGGGCIGRPQRRPARRSSPSRRSDRCRGRLRTGGAGGQRGAASPGRDHGGGAGGSRPSSARWRNGSRPSGRASSRNPSPPSRRTRPR